MTLDYDGAENTPKSMGTDSSQPSSPLYNILNDSQISQFCNDWNKTEKWVKKGENINGNVVLPSINEMRYAGRRLVDAFEAAEKNDAEAAMRHFSEARDNLIKARHDAVDSIIHHFSENTNKYRENLGAGNLQKHFSEYGTLFSLLKNIESEISNSREKRENRDTIYGKIMQKDLPKLCELYSSLDASIPAIEQNIKKEDRHRAEEMQQMATTRSISIWIAIISSIIAIIGWAIVITR